MAVSERKVNVCFVWHSWRNKPGEVVSLKVHEHFTNPGPCLYVCSTPIGNLQDASFRLIDTLKLADIVAAEDTRHTRKLLTHFDIHPTQLVSYHQHNRASRAGDLVRWWEEGKSIALVSDAGTPGISDPGDDAVSLALEHDVPVIPVPGASAVLSALVVSGFPSQPFTFLGFLPRTRVRAIQALSPFRNIPGCLVCYEAPHRVAKVLEVLLEVMPSRKVSVAKELTKRHETILYGSIEEILDHFSMHEPRGEYVIVVGPPVSSDELTEAEGLVSEEAKMLQAVEAVYAAIEAGSSHAQAVRAVSQSTGVRRKWLYQKTLS
jgi:16S rRNA (cytidine1402-2'-O)-methyltransferase